MYKKVTARREEIFKIHNNTTSQTKREKCEVLLCYLNLRATELAPVKKGWFGLW